MNKKYLPKDNFILIFFSILIIGFLTDIRLISPVQASETDKETEKFLKIFNESVKMLKEKYYSPLSFKEILLRKTQEVINSADSHAFLFPPEAFKELHIPKSYRKIGVLVTSADGIVTVVSPQQGTHAFKAGIMPGDKILMIDGEPLKPWEFPHKRWGPADIPAILTVLRNNNSGPTEIKIFRDTVQMESVCFSLPEPGYAYTRLTGSGLGPVSAKFKNYLEKYDVPLKGLILDFRYSLFGSLKDAVEFADFFIKKGIIVSVKGRLQNYSDKIFMATPDKTHYDYPIVVLINKGTAGCSEVIVGALQDHRRALILGTASYGNGAVSTVEPLANDYGINFSVTQYLTPKGREIEKNGITPDVFIDYPLYSNSYERNLIFSDDDVTIKTAIEILKKSPLNKPDEMLSVAEDVVKFEMSQKRKREPAKIGKEGREKRKRP